MDKDMLTPEEILELSQKVKGFTADEEYLSGEGADFKAGIINGYEYAVDKLRGRLKDEPPADKVEAVMDKAMAETGSIDKGSFAQYVDEEKLRGIAIDIFNQGYESKSGIPRENILFDKRVDQILDLIKGYRRER